MSLSSKARYEQSASQLQTSVFTAANWRVGQRQSEYKDDIIPEDAQQLPLLLYDDHGTGPVVIPPSPVPSPIAPGFKIGAADPLLSSVTTVPAYHGLDGRNRAAESRKHRPL